MANRNMKETPKLSIPMYLLITVLGILLCIMGLLLALAEPIAGIIAVVFGVLVIVYARKRKPVKKSDEDAVVDAPVVSVDDPFSKAKQPKTDMPFVKMPQSEKVADTAPSAPKTYHHNYAVAADYDFHIEEYEPFEDEQRPIYDYELIKLTSMKALTSFRKSPYIVFDTETTGLSPMRDRIIELAMLKVFPDGSTDTYVSFFNPERKLSPIIIKKTGITDSDLIDAPLFEEKADEIIEFISDLPLVAHNAHFDCKFLCAEMSQSAEMPHLQAVDTLILSRKAFPNTSDHKLNTLIRELNLKDGEQSHRAEDDAVCTQKLLCLCLDELIRLKRIELDEKKARRASANQ